jgi:hypothetical protein
MRWLSGTGNEEKVVIAMAAPKNVRLRADFDEWFPQGLFLVGEITAVMEYQSQEDRARNRPVRPRIDEATGLPLYRDTFADPAAEKEREESVGINRHEERDENARHRRSSDPRWP